MISSQTSSRNTPRNFRSPKTRPAGALLYRATVTSPKRSSTTDYGQRNAHDLRVVGVPLCCPKAKERSLKFAVAMVAGRRLKPSRVGCVKSTIGGLWRLVTRSAVSTGVTSQRWPKVYVMVTTGNCLMAKSLSHSWLPHIFAPFRAAGIPTPETVYAAATIDSVRREMI